MNAILIASDPGQKQSALAVVSPAPGNRIAILRGEMVPSDRSSLIAFVRDVVARYGMPAAIAVESAGEDANAYAPYRVPGLIGAERAATRLEMIAGSANIQFLQTKAADCRKAVIGKLPRATKVPGVKVAKPKWDVLIEKALPLFVVGIDKSNVHLRDAFCVAVWASRLVWRYGGRAA